MPENRYYYYDHESCSFVEVQPTRKERYRKAAMVVVAALLLSSVALVGLDLFFGTPEELALESENEALQEQLTHAQQRMEHFSSELDELAESDRELYRKLLEADPISKDVRQVGVGGTDPYEAFSGFSASTSTLLRETSQQLDQLERQISLQNTSYRELNNLAKEHDLRLSQMPAILPADGPVVSGYGMRHHPILKVRKMHHGLDLLVNRGTPVYATGDGVITEAGRGVGYGKYVLIDHPEAGYQTLYGHLSEIPRRIRRGRKVKRGDQIGLSGSTGRSTAPHLHYEVRDADGRTLNPIYFFAPSITPQEYKSMIEAAETSTTSLD